MLRPGAHSLRLFEGWAIDLALLPPPQMQLIHWAWKNHHNLQLGTWLLVPTFSTKRWSFGVYNIYIHMCVCVCLCVCVVCFWMYIIYIYIYYYYYHYYYYYYCIYIIYIYINSTILQKKHESWTSTNAWDHEHLTAKWGRWVQWCNVWQPTWGFPSVIHQLFDFLKHRPLELWWFQLKLGTFFWSKGQVGRPLVRTTALNHFGAWPVSPMPIVL